MIPSVPNTRMPSAIPIGANRIATIVWANRFILVASPVEPDNVNVHRAAANRLTIKKPRDPRPRVQRIVIPRVFERTAYCKLPARLICAVPISIDLGL